MLIKFLDMIPEENREEFKEVSAKAVFLNTKEDVQKLIDSNDLLKGILQAERDKRYAEMERKFNDEKLPGIIEKRLAEEKKKGEKQPWEIEIEKLRAETDAAKREAIYEKQKARALTKNAEYGLPTEILDKYVGNNDAETDANIALLADALGQWREDAIQNELKKVGIQPTPQGGTSGGIDFSAMTLDEMQDYARKSPQNERAIIEWQNKH